MQAVKCYSRWDSCTAFGWMVKHISGLCGVNKMMKNWKKCDSDACPQCGEKEDACHMWWCPQPEAQHVCSQSIFKLGQWMETQNTAPDIVDIVLSRLSSLSHGTHPQALDPTYPGANQALTNQDLIGWMNFLEGCIAQRWTDSQQAFTTSGSTRQPTYRAKMDDCIDPKAM